MQKPDNFDAMLRNVGFAADNASIESKAAGDTAATNTRKSVAAAFTSALVNGMITINPESEWIEWMSIDTKFDD